MDEDQSMDFSLDEQYEEKLDAPYSPNSSTDVNSLKDTGPASPDEERSNDYPLSKDASPKETASRPHDSSGSDPGAGRSEDSEEESDKEEKTTPSKKRIDSSDSEEDSKKQASSDNEEESKIPTKRKIESSSESESESNRKQEESPKKQQRLKSDDEEDQDEKIHKNKESDAEASDKEEEGEGLIADIFGDSSDEEEEFQGFDEDDIKKPAAPENALPEVSSEDELEDDQGNRSNFVSDFDLMMAQKKEERAKSRRRKRNVDIINDNDDLIVDLLKRMREASEDDRDLNKNHQPALKKLTMLPSVIKQLNKAELQNAFLDSGLLSALTEWLAPLPDKSLPHLTIREGLLKLLCSLPVPHTDQLKSSGIGKAVMYLFKHPKEVKANKDMAGKLINEWSRPIFGQSSNFKAVSREEREKRDLQSYKGRRKSSDSGAKEEEQKALRPGDPGWIYRARVPRPSNKEYVVRPENKVDEISLSKSSKKSVNRFEQQKRRLDTKKKMMKSQQAVKISIEGRNM